MARLERLFRPAQRPCRMGERRAVRQVRGLALFANIRLVLLKR